MVLLLEDKLINALIKIVKQDSIPALGCTEPISVALAGAATREHITGEVENIEVIVSKNIFKNGKFVIIPNTNRWWLDLAAALGILGGNKEKGLMVLSEIDERIIEDAEMLIENNKIKVEYVENVPDVFVKIIVTTINEQIEVVLKDSHEHIETVKVDGETIFQNEIEDGNRQACSFLKRLTFRELRDICENIPIEQLKFIEIGIEMNSKAAEKGLSWDEGAGIGATLKRLQKRGMISNEAPTEARILTAAAADIRMGGGNCPIMTSAGSGNQGLGVVLPIVVVAEEEGIEGEKLLRAVFFAHVINRYVKIYTGKLSAMCGCAIAAGIGASAGITWLLGGDDSQIEGACQNMLANLTGMICDGAKETCSLKLSTSAEEAVISAYLAMENVIVKPNIGIIGYTIEDTIRNLGVLCIEGLPYMDSAIIKILENVQ